MNIPSISINPISPGFNPCFCGSTSQVIASFANGAGSLGFNPCFCGSTSQVGIPGIEGPTQESFQSLFLWKYVSGLEYTLKTLNRNPVSILVFVEVRLRSTPPEVTREILTKFQSLFLWKYVSGPHVGIG